MRLASPVRDTLELGLGKAWTLEALWAKKVRHESASVQKALTDCAAYVKAAATKTAVIFMMRAEVECVGSG